MRTYSGAPLLFALTFGTAYLAREMIVPNVLPVADGEQSNWQIQVAFVLRSVENIGLGGAALVILMFVLNLLKKSYGLVDMLS
jgi:hypothetical protein